MDNEETRVKEEELTNNHTRTIEKIYKTQLYYEELYTTLRIHSEPLTDNEINEMITRQRVLGFTVQSDNITDNTIAIMYNSNTELTVELFGKYGISMPEDCTRLFSSLSFNCIDLTDIKLYPTTCFSMFYNSKLMDTVLFGEVDTSKCKYMHYMFNGCDSLESIDLTDFDFSKVERTDYMFDCCRRIQSIRLGDFNAPELEDMSYMFYECLELETLEFDNAHTPKLKYLTSTFECCKKIDRIYIDKIDTSNVENMNNTFGKCNSLKSVDLSTLNLRNLKDVGNLFFFCTGLERIKIVNNTIVKLRNLVDAFAGCEKLTDVELEFNTSNVKEAYKLFFKCKSLKTLDLGFLKDSPCTYLVGLCEECENLKTVDMSKMNFAVIENMGRAFYNCTSLENVILPDTKQQAIDTNFKVLRSMFDGCQSLKSIDLSCFKASKLEDMGGIFSMCYNLETVKMLDLSEDKLEKLNKEFYNCISLKSVDLSTLKGEKIKDINNTFEDCKVLEHVNMKNYKADFLQLSYKIFDGCDKLTKEGIIANEKIKELLSAECMKIFEF